MWWYRSGPAGVIIGRSVQTARSDACGARAKRPYQVESQVAPFRKVGCHVEVGQPLKEFYEYPYLGIGERVGQLCLVGGDVMALRISRRAPISDLR